MFVVAVTAASCSNSNPPPFTKTGLPCSNNSDCQSGICLPVGQPQGGGTGWTGNVCTTTCNGPSDCVSGWLCGALLGRSSNVCQCQYAPETCDGKDNDCNGVVDDEPEADAWCAQQLGAGHVCRSGACVIESDGGGDGGPNDGSTDGASDGAGDASGDSASDAPGDSASDASGDSASDASSDAASDASSDASSDADAGCSKVVACEQCNVSGYTPAAQSPPLSSTNACTSTQITNFVTACLSSTATSQTCSAWQTSMADAGACTSCIFTQQSASTWGPLVCASTSCFLNTPGCVDLELAQVSQEKANGGSGSCGDLVSDEYGCVRYACGSCTTTSDITQCRQSATTNECASYVSAVNTSSKCTALQSDAGDAGPVNRCFPQTNSDLATFVNVFCGTGP